MPTPTPATAKPSPDRKPTLAKNDPTDATSLTPNDDRLHRPRAEVMIKATKERQGFPLPTKTQQNDLSAS